MITSNKTIAKNSLYLYIRMFVVMALNLYMVRVLLVMLGQQDYGIYTLIAGVANLLTFLNTTMSSATSRFLTYEIGRGDAIRVNQTFRTALFLHISIAVILFLIAESLGLWFVNTQLSIPANRLVAANVVYQSALFCMVLKIIQVPFSASILSNEKMNIYAFFEINYTVLLLIGIISLKYYSGDLLIAYGLLLLFSTTVNLFSYIIYAKSKLTECHNLTPTNKREQLLPMLAFSGWDLFGNLCVSVRIQGLGVLLNSFFGAFLNAAAGVAGQVQAAVLAFTSAVTAAFRPQIIKAYSIEDYTRLRELLGLSMTLGILLFSMMGVPIFFELPYILRLWLIDPPIYTTELARLMLIASFLGVINSILIIPIHAQGHIKLLSIMGGLLHLITLPLGYFMLGILSHPTIVYWANGISMGLSVIFTLFLLHRQIPQIKIQDLISKELTSLFGIFILSLCTPLLIRYANIEEGLLRCFLTTIFYCFFLCSLIYLIKLNTAERKYIKCWLLKQIKR